MTRIVPSHSLKEIASVLEGEMYNPNSYFGTRITRDVFRAYLRDRYLSGPGSPVPVGSVRRSSDVLLATFALPPGCRALSLDAAGNAWICFATRTVAYVALHDLSLPESAATAPTTIPSAELRRIGSCGTWSDQFRAPSGVCVLPGGDLVTLDTGTGRTTLWSSVGRMVRLLESQATHAVADRALVCSRDGYVHYFVNGARATVERRVLDVIVQATPESHPSGADAVAFDHRNRMVQLAGAGSIIILPPGRKETKERALKLSHEICTETPFYFALDHSSFAVLAYITIAGFERVAVVDVFRRRDGHLERTFRFPDFSGYLGGLAIDAEGLIYVLNCGPSVVHVLGPQKGQPVK